jgi:thiamine biosynthesis lipoprotein
VPVEKRRCYVLAPTAALSDALSTAFMIMSPAEVQDFLREHPQVQQVV